MKISSKIKKIRELRDYTQTYMADMLGISQSTYAKIESGASELNVSRLREIGKILEIDPVQLINIEGSQYINQVYHSQVGSGQYIDQRNTEDLTIIRGQFEELRKMIEVLARKMNQVA